MVFKRIVRISPFFGFPRFTVAVVRFYRQERGVGQLRGRRWGRDYEITQRQVARLLQSLTDYEPEVDLGALEEDGRFVIEFDATRRDR